MSIEALPTRRSLGCFALALMASASPARLLAQSSGQPAASAAPLVLSDLLPWVVRVRDAAANRSYQGTLVHTAAGVVSSTRIAHVSEGRERYERIENLDGQPRLQYRHNDQVVTVWPDSKVAVVERQDAVPEFPALPYVEALKSLDHYELRKVGKDRVAGFDVDVLLLKPRDAHRFAHRFWAERETGLLLRGDVLGPQGELLETSAFSDLRLGAKLAPDAVRQPMKRLEGLRVVHAHAVKTSLDAEGWQLARAMPGFVPVSCTRRPLDAADGQPTPVLLTVFSDGITHVSLFIEAYDAQRHKQALRTSMGATHTLMTRRADKWITLVGEVPMATVVQFEALLERRR